MINNDINLPKRSKAAALKYIKDKLNKFTVPDFLSFKVKKYHDQREIIIENIINHFEYTSCKLAIRSSSHIEDSADNSHAGEFETILNVESSNKKHISNAIDLVIKSYSKNLNVLNDNDEVIVQLMIENILMSGVIFTYDLNSGAPYYVVNYDDISGMSNTVTSGSGEYSNRTLYIYRNSTESVKSPRFKKLIEAVKELELKSKKQFLDIEFSIDKDLNLYLFQYRSMYKSLNWNSISTKDIETALKEIKSVVKKRYKSESDVYGSKNVFGQMPDWNPAEMIGRAPRILSYSLYEKLITDYAWIKAREEMGYYNPGSKPLMVSLYGQPFIDTRLSFNSFFPNAINPKSANKLIDVWVEKLKNFPEYHDKVEFNVAITCWTFDIEKKIEILTEDCLSSDEIIEYKNILKKQFLEILSDNEDSGITECLNKIETLQKKQKSNVDDINNGDISFLSNYIDDCIELGTIPFAKLARHGFIAKSLLLSLENIGILSSKDINDFQLSINTVASDLIRDMVDVSNNKKSKTDFMKLYGHLRPGTYDILSPRYDQINNFMTSIKSFKNKKKKIDFKLNLNQKIEIEKLLNNEKITNLNADKLMSYIKKATVAREYSKFIFTKSVSNILELIANFGKKINLSREDMAFLPLEKLLLIDPNTNHKSIEMELRKISKIYKRKQVISYCIRLPQVIVDVESIYVIPFQVSQPNFITKKNVSAELVFLKPSDMNVQLKLANKIVFIESADPGFDWIFSYGISGLITKYGGANSHMTIRCAEFNIPAAIGCGEQRFEKLLKSKIINLDCGSSLINTIE